MTDQGLTEDDVRRIVREETEELREENEQLVERVDELEEEKEQLREERDQERERRRELEDRVDDLEEELDERAALRWDSDDFDDARVESGDGSIYPVGRALANKVGETDLEEELDELRERLADGDLAGDVQEGGAGVERETPLEDVVALPESVAEDNLSANQERARFIASDVVEYGDKVPVGRRLTAGRIGKILRAGRDVDPHPETVARVMAIVDDLGGDGVTKRKKNGEKRIVVDDDLAARLERLDDVQAHDAMSRGSA